MSVLPVRARLSRAICRGEKANLLFVEEDDFGVEGGFTRWTVQLVSGNTDQQTPDTAVWLRAEDF
jgi:hypothetical protein